MKDDHGCHRCGRSISDCRCQQDDAAEHGVAADSAATADVPCSAEVRQTTETSQNVLNEAKQRAAIRLARFEAFTEALDIIAGHDGDAIDEITRGIEELRSAAKPRGHGRSDARPGDPTLRHVVAWIRQYAETRGHVDHPLWTEARLTEGEASGLADVLDRVFLARPEPPVTHDDIRHPCGANTCRAPQLGAELLRLRRNEANPVVAQPWGPRHCVLCGRQDDLVTRCGTCDTNVIASCELRAVSEAHPREAIPAPHVTVADLDGEIVFEWWRGEEKRTLYVHPGDAIRVDASGIADTTVAEVLTWLRRERAQPTKDSELSEGQKAASPARTADGSALPSGTATSSRAEALESPGASSCPNASRASDKKRAHQWLDAGNAGDDWHGDYAIPALADLIADVRRETVEACAAVAQDYREKMARNASSARAVGVDDMVHVEHGLAAMQVAHQIRALLRTCAAEEPKR